ncbi:MAG: galactose-1-phosphate uridylyltransferase [Eubacteriales bacterium]
MAELRWNPMINDWVMIASNRQNRPNMPKDWCPFCPSDENDNVPRHYDVYKYDNDFPALSQEPPAPEHPYTDRAGDIYKVAPSYGKCEVILFSPEHNGRLCELSVPHITKLVDLWVERFEAMSADKNIKYVFIFENRGEAVGVSMPHPHGQIYGFSVLPKKMELELQSARSFKEEHGECLFCRINEEEAAFGERVVCENEDFIAYIPFFADYAYGTYIAAKAHKQNIAQFNARERENLARIIKQVTGAYDNLFPELPRFPYMMCMHNCPVNLDESYGNTDEYYHFHIEFYPPMRDAVKQQFMASSETGVWAHCNPTAPEAKAADLRAALERMENGDGDGDALLS